MAKALSPILLLVLLLAACQAAPTAASVTPSPTLPPPHLEHNRTPSAPAATAQSTAAPSPTTFPQELPELARALYGDRLPTWVAIPALTLKAPVVPVGWTAEDDIDLADLRWDSPEASVGWVIESGLPGAGSGNTLLYGHNNIHSSIFRDLYTLQPGDVVILTNGQGDWRYSVDSVQVLPVESSPADKMIYAAALKDSLAPRLTIIACYPPDGNTHRVLVTAFPSP
ncbi:MAG: sortase [Anaerolineae bacterium]|nr:sortase [Anaerolineae bacterium]